MSKSVEAFRTIGEVADELEVPKHVLRFWEGKFPHIRPMKRGGGRRYYRPEDMELLRGIRHLLHAEGYTIKGVQKILRLQGVDQVKAAAASAATSSSDDRAANARNKTAATAKVTAAAAAKVIAAAKAKNPDGGLKAVGEAAKPAGAKEPVAAKDKAAPAGSAPDSKAVIAAAVRELEICRQLLIAGGAKPAGLPAQQLRAARS
jgi:DNA-binding transcriptional MerR regulator